MEEQVKEDKPKRLYELVALKDGQTAISLMPKLKGIAAIVDFATLQRIAKMLGSARFSEIKDLLQFKLETVENMEDYMKLLKGEVAFHETFNKIASIDLNEVTQNIAKFEAPVEKLNPEQTPLA